MNAALKAGMVYFSAVFVVAFMLGTIRVLVLVPRLGEIAAVSLEAPAILAVSWFASRWTTKKFRVTSEVSSRLLMGAVAFALLMVVEGGVSVFAFGRPIEGYLAAFWSSQGMIGLVAQIAFAFIPLMQRTQG